MPDSSTMNRNKRTSLIPSRPLSARDDLVARILFSCPLPPLEERLLLRLLHLANSSGSVRRASEAALAHSLRRSDRAVRRALKTLEAAGLMESQRPRYPQRGETAVYHLDVRRITELSDDWYRNASYNNGRWTIGSFLRTARHNRHALDGVGLRKSA